MSDDIVGIIKEIDNLGRIVIPKDFRDRLLIDKTVEILLTSDGILIRNPEYKLTKRIINQKTNMTYRG